MLIIAYVRSRRQGIAYARRVATELDAAKLHLAGAQHGTGDEVGVDARAIRDGRPVVVLAIRRYLADEVFAFHRSGDGERLLVAYDLGVVSDVATGPGRAGEPGVGPGAGVGDGVGRTVEIILILVIHVCPKRRASLERTRRRGIRVVLILGVLDADPGHAGKRRGRSGSGLRLALLRCDGCHRDGRFGFHFFSIRRIARRRLIDRGARNGRSVTRRTSSASSIGALFSGRAVRPNLGIACARIARNSIGRSRKRWLVSSSALGVFIREGRARSKRRRHRHRDKHGDHALPKSLCILMGIILGDAAWGRSIRRIATSCEHFSARKEWTESHRYLTSRAQCDG